MPFQNLFAFCNPLDCMIELATLTQDLPLKCIMPCGVLFLQEDVNESTAAVLAGKFL
jgi:hypothetical protein